LDERLLAMDWRALRMGVWQLDCASANDGSLDGRSLGTPAGRLGVDRRSLAVSFAPGSSRKSILAVKESICSTLGWARSWIYASTRAATNSADARDCSRTGCDRSLGSGALIYFKQHSMIYHPRPYDPSYARCYWQTAKKFPIPCLLGKQTAFYIPARDNGRLQARPWIAFCGNGSLALDWTTILAGYPNSDDAFLLVDYPGYGKCQGYATIANMRASSDAALDMLAKRLGLSGEDLDPRLCTIGHSLGSAVALDFAARHRIQRVVAISPFTTLREEAACIIGGPLSHLLIESYDNRSSITEIRKRNPEAKIAIFHGTNDKVIPVRMGRELAREFPFIEFFAVDGANHVSVLSEAHDKIIHWMNN
jgi:uncharacterized protein